MCLHLNRILAAMAAVSLSGAVLAGGSHAGDHATPVKAAIGEPGDPVRVTRTITLDMSDSMRFTPATLQVRAGETVRLQVRNTGRIKHEISLGTEQALLAHLAEMRRFPDMEHDEPGKLSLQPGQRGEIVWHFTQGGTVHFACLLPGHFEAGMRGTVEVAS